MYTDAMENSIEVPQKTENETAIWSSNSKTSMEETKIQEDISPTMFLASLFTIAKMWTQPKYSSADEWV